MRVATTTAAGGSLSPPAGQLPALPGGGRPVDRACLVDTPRPRGYEHPAGAGWAWGGVGWGLEGHAPSPLHFPCCSPSLSLDHGPRTALLHFKGPAKTGTTQFAASAQARLLHARPALQAWHSARATTPPRGSACAGCSGCSTRAACQRRRSWTMERGLGCSRWQRCCWGRGER